jgi:hypothetical protein
MSLASPAAIAQIRKFRAEGVKVNFYGPDNPAVGWVVIKGEVMDLCPNGELVTNWFVMEARWERAQAEQEWMRESYLSHDRAVARLDWQKL